MSGATCRRQWMTRRKFTTRSRFVTVMAPQSALAGFTSTPESCQQGLMGAGRIASGPALAAAAFIITGCQLGAPPPQTASLTPTVDARQKEIADRKDEMIRQLAHCE